MSQLNLWQSGDKRQVFVPDVSLEQLQISRLNPRHFRDEKRIESIADLIVKNGFDQTCAPKAHKTNGTYEIFAGGNRFMAAKKAGCESIPVYLYEGYDDSEIWHLAYLDNEQAEKHQKVRDVDVWLDYKARKAAGWTQQEIAAALGVSQTMVSFRIRCAELPQSILDIFINSEFLNERHALELLKLLTVNNLEQWMDFEKAATHCIKRVLDKVVAPTHKHFADAVKDMNAVMALAGELCQKLAPDYHGAFVSRLSSKLDSYGATTATTKAEVTQAYNVVLREMLNDAREREDEAARQASRAEQERLRLEREAKLAAEKDRVMAKLVHGDSRVAATSAPNGIRLLLTDPPYGKDFQSNRRVASAQAPKLVNDDQNAFALLSDVLQAVYPKMADDSFAVVWTDWKYYSAFEKIVLSVGFDIRTVIVWNKPNHGTGDLEGTPAPKHEWAIFAVKGNPKLNFRFDNVMSGGKFIGTEHPTEKPVDLLETVIKATTAEGDLVADPFAGGGSTPITAFKLQRNFWACELDESWHSQAKEKLFDVVEAQFNG